MKVASIFVKVASWQSDIVQLKVSEVAFHKMSSPRSKSITGAMLFMKAVASQVGSSRNPRHSSCSRPASRVCSSSRKRLSLCLLLHTLSDRVPTLELLPVADSVSWTSCGFESRWIDRYPVISNRINTNLSVLV